MPQMKNITVKKADGTTDITFNAIVASAGDSSPALWRVEAASPVPARRPTLTAVSRNNGAKTARNVRFLGSFADFDADGAEIGRIPFELGVIVPQQLSDTFVREAVVQFLNSAKSPDVVEMLITGYSPT